MSRYYSMVVKITNYDQEREDDINGALCEEWPFHTTILGNTDDGRRIFRNGDSNLRRGESEEEFAARVARAVHNANRGPCTLEVNATCLEYLPCETYSFSNPEDFEELIKEKSQDA